MARTIYGEARGETFPGKVAVGFVILNRANDPNKRYGNGVAGVCQKPKQFSCWNADDPNLPKLQTVNATDINYVQCLAAAAWALSDMQSDPTYGSTHYHTTNSSPYWAVNKAVAARIGNHLFYNNID